MLDGPPGTGKSQTIANMIAHNLALGRKVLFVAEKRAALEVVYGRLDNEGLGPFCLELHSNKASKLEVVRQLGRAWDTLEDSPGEAWAHDASELKALRDEMNTVVRLLHEPRAAGVSLHEAIGRVVRDGSPQTPEFSWPTGRTIDRAVLARMRDAARRIDLNFANIAGVSRDDFAWIGEGDWSPAWQSGALTAATQAAAAANELEEAQSGLLGVLSLPLGSDPGTLSALDRLAEALCAADGVDLTMAFAPDYGAITAAARAAFEHLSAYRSEEAALSTRYAREAARTLPVEALQVRWAAAQRKVWPFCVFARMAMRKALQAAGGCASAPVPEHDLPVLSKMRAALTGLDGLEAQSRRVGGWAGLDTQADVAERTLNTAAALTAAMTRIAISPDDLVKVKLATRALAVDGNQLLAEGQSARRALERYRHAWAGYCVALDRFRTAARTPARVGSASGLADVRTALERVLASRTSINAWCGWMRVRGEAMDLDLSPLVEAAEAGNLGEDGAAGALETGYAAWLANMVIDREPLLRRFLPAEHEAKIADFRKLDDALATMSSREIRAKLSGKISRKDDRRLPPGYGALKYQLELKAPRKALRELAAEMGDTLTTLTPCLLMSPLSVAQYLPADTPFSTWSIFDEASQITPWDAVGAIARGKQLVVAGDPKQMPPTSFFDRGAGRRRSR